MLAAVTRGGAPEAGVSTCEDPSVEEACAGDWGNCDGGGEGGDVVEEGDTKPSHFMLKMRYLGEETG